VIQKEAEGWKCSKESHVASPFSSIYCG